ncbi:MAG TPA: tail fiber domain-containing protein [Chitinophagaceae bacterium]|nr:tail fiber domain-containing protein [Chitinophagaceae bacterium]
MKKYTLLVAVTGAMMIYSQANAQSKLTIVNESWGYFSNPPIVTESRATGGWALSEGIVAVGRGGFDNYGVRGHALGGTNYNVGVYGLADSAWITGVGVFGQSLRARSSNYGVYGHASGGIGPAWAGYFNGNVFTTGTYQPSDGRLKRDVQNEESVMQRIMKLRPVSYSYKKDEFKYIELPDSRQHGFIAEELQKIFPESVIQVKHPVVEDNKVTKTEEFAAINYQSLIPVLFKAIQEQQAMIEDLQKQVKELGGGKKITRGGMQGAYLAEAVPNPANASTTIRYALPDNAQKASIQIFDATGNKVLQYNNIKGESQIVVNSAQLAAGTYVYTLYISGRAVQTNKFVVAKG